MKNKPKLFFGGQSKPNVNMHKVHEPYSDTKLLGVGAPRPPKGRGNGIGTPTFQSMIYPWHVTQPPTHIMYFSLKFDAPGTCKTGCLLVRAPQGRKITIHFHSGTQFSGSACVHTYIICKEDIPTAGCFVCFAGACHF